MQIYRTEKNETSKNAFERLPEVGQRLTSGRATAEATPGQFGPQAVSLEKAAH